MCGVDAIDEEVVLGNAYFGVDTLVDNMFVIGKSAGIKELRR